MNSCTFHHHQPATSLTLSRKIKNENWKLAKVIFISLYNKIKEAGWAEEKFCSMLWGLCKCSHPLYSESERERERDRDREIQCNSMWEECIICSLFYIHLEFQVHFRSFTFCCRVVLHCSLIPDGLVVRCSLH